MKKPFNYLFLMLILLFGFFKTYSLHYDFKYPYHHDEWQHIAISKQIIESGYNKKHNPYLDISRPHTDIESGFHLGLANLLILTKLDPVLSYQYFAAFYSIISGLAVFYCVYKLTKKYFIGILSLMIFISLPTNTNILGKEYFVPLTVVIPFMFMFVLYYLQGLEEKNTKKFFLAGFLLLIIFLIHPPTFIILSIPSALILLMNLDFFKDKLSHVAVLTILVGFFSFFIVWKGTFSLTLEYLSGLLYFQPGWGKLEITYYIPFLYGIINTLFAVAGFLIILGYTKKTKLWFFIMLAFISLTITTLFNIKGYTYLIPYMRAIHYSMLGLLPLTAYGFYLILEYMTKRFKIKSKDIFYVIFSVIFLFLIVNNTYSLNREYQRYSFPVIEESDYQALKFVEKNYDKERIIVPYFMTSAVYPISGHTTISIIPAQLGGGLQNENYNFYGYNCTGKFEIMNQTDSSLILSKIPIGCNYLEQVYYGRTFIYSLKNSLQ